MKKLKNFLGIIGSFVVSIILFVLLIVLGANIAAKNFLKISSFSNIVQKMDFQGIESCCKDNG